MFNTPDQAPLRGTSTPDKEFGFYDATVDGGWQIPGEPYSSASSDEPSKNSGGGARACSAAAPTIGAASLCATARTISNRTLATGSASTGPCKYEDIAPYYDKVEMLIGVYGENDGLENTPDSPAGCLLPAPKGRARRIADSEAREEDSACR